MIDYNLSDEKYNAIVVGGILNIYIKIYKINIITIVIIFEIVLNNLPFLYAFKHLSSSSPIIFLAILNSIIPAASRMIVTTKLV